MVKNDFLSDEYLEKVNKYWNATNYLSVGQLYLLDNPLLKRKLEKKDIKKKIVGHWGTVPGQNFVYVHCNRAIKKFDLDMILISGPGHGGNFFIANSYLEKTYSEVYPHISYDEKGMQKLFKQFSFPGGVSSHVAPETPGSMHEGGELGYSLLHGFGAVFDNPNLIATVIVGDGEAETGPLATSWHSNKFLNPKNDGAVLPILHLNGYKISNPTVLSRISQNELLSLFEGYGWEPIIVEGNEPMQMHKKMALAMDECVQKIKQIQTQARSGKTTQRPKWPMIILRTPKGWTCPEYVDDVKIQGSFNSHQVPISMQKQEHLQLLEQWLKSYEPQKLFDKNGTLIAELQELAPVGDKRISANPITNGGKNPPKLILPNVLDFGVDIEKFGQQKAQDMLELGKYLAKVVKLNSQNRNFRIFSPDEMKSNRLTPVFEETSRQVEFDIDANDEYLSNDGFVFDSYLSEHACEGWLEGYILTGRNGIFASYEAFARVIDSMVAQHIKWLKICSRLPWRRPISSLNLILTSNVWQQDHNGFTHQDPGMIDNVIDKKGNVARVYLPPDTNCLVQCVDHCLQTQNYVNLIVASKHPSFQWLTKEQAKVHCEKGISEWKFASNNGDKADVVLACCGDTPTQEMMAVSQIMKQHLPYINFKFVNVVDLMRLESPQTHPHALDDEDFDKIFTVDKPVIFAYHGYPKLIHELCYKRKNAHNFHVAGYKEEGAITTAFDMRVRNKIDRFNLMLMILKEVPQIKPSDKRKLEKLFKDKLEFHTEYINEYGVDIPEIENWKFVN